MPDPEAIATDTPPDVQAHGETTGGSPDGAAPELFFGKYKSKDEAERAYLEAQQKISQLGEEAARLRQQADMKTVLENLARAPEATRTPEPKQPLDVKTFSARVADRLQTDAAGGIEELLQAVGGWTQESTKEAKSLAESQLAAIDKKLNSLAETLERKDPFYEKHQARIDRLMGGGMSMTSAKKFVREDLASQPAPTVDTGVERIGGASVSTGRVTQRPVAKEAYLSADERASLKADGMTDEMLNDMEAEYANRKARGGVK